MKKGYIIAALLCICLISLTFLDTKSNDWSGYNYINRDYRYLEDVKITRGERFLPDSDVFQRDFSDERYTVKLDETNLQHSYGEYVRIDRQGYIVGLRNGIVPVTFNVFDSKLKQYKAYVRYNIIIMPIEEDYREIKNVYNWMTMDKNGCYKLASDLVFTEPFGFNRFEDPFNGTIINPDNYKIEISLNALRNDFALLETIGEHGYINGLSFSSVTVNCLTGDPLSVFAAPLTLHNYGYIENCTVNNLSFDGYRAIGGLVRGNSGRISGCSVKGRISGTESLGGITAYDMSPYFSNESYGAPNIYNCTTEVEITGESYIGGICGSFSKVIYKDCTVFGNINVRKNAYNQYSQDVNGIGVYSGVVGNYFENCNFYGEIKHI